MSLPETSGLSSHELTIGDVFTPIEWAVFAIREFEIYTKWIEGATVFDPTMGEGNLLEALISYGLQQGKQISELPVHRLFGNELNRKYYQRALDKFDTQYGLDMSSNFSNEDFLKLRTPAYDLLFGNPPWCNFTRLPEAYKNAVKQDFIDYDLVSSPKQLLLGGSRIDIAALIIQKAIRDSLAPHGKAVFFMPLSLLLNDGAHQHFRNYRVREVQYAPEKIVDFKGTGIFGTIATRHGLVSFTRDKAPSFPLPYLTYTNGDWHTALARPLFLPNDPLSVRSASEPELLSDFTPIRIKKESKPRQGINTGGANAVFFFDQYRDIDTDTVEVSNRQGHKAVVSRHLIYPLLSAVEFRQGLQNPSKWVLLPYGSDGKPLSRQALEHYPETWQYLQQQQALLESRKGLLLKGMLSRGYWWGLLGVGSYNFAPYKIVWEASGKNEFNPILAEGRWQVNQSLQAYIPVGTRSEAEYLLSRLQDKKVEHYLRSLKMEGTLSWAQPGKIRKLLCVAEEN